MPALRDTAEDVLTDPVVIEAMERGFIELKGDRVTYNLASKKTYDWSDPEEWVVENKAAGQTAAARKQWIEQLLGNANSLRAVGALRRAYRKHSL